MPASHPTKDSGPESRWPTAPTLSGCISGETQPPCKALPCPLQGPRDWGIGADAAASGDGAPGATCPFLCGPAHLLQGGSWAPGVCEATVGADGFAAT